MARALLFWLGVLLVAMGLLWAGQGRGYIHWPRQSFMIGQGVWALRGAALALAGMLLMLLSRRMRSRIVRNRPPEA